MRKLPSMWRRSSERYNLIGCKCENCGQSYFPQRSVCPVCRRHGRLIPDYMPREGKILTFSEVHSAPTGFEVEAPYFLAIVELPNKVRVTTQIVDTPADKIKIGAKAKMVFRKIFEEDHEGAIAYGFKFKVE